MAELAADFRVGLGVNEIDDTRPRPLVLGRIHPGTAGRDPPLGTDAGHLGTDQSGTAFGAFAVLHEMPIGRQPSVALYCAIGDTTMRFFNRISRRRNGANIGRRTLLSPAPASR